MDLKNGKKINNIYLYMTYNLGIQNIIPVHGYRAPTGLSSDYISNKKSKIITCNIIKPFGCRIQSDNKLINLTQNDYILVKKGFFRK